MLYGFLLSADPASCSLPALAERHLGHSVDAGPAAEADAILAIFNKLRPDVETAGLADVYAKIDLPLIRVLADMESTGIRVDPAQLHVLSGRMEEEMARLSARDLRAGRKILQHQLAATIRQGSVRRLEPARARAIRQRQSDLHRRRRPGRPGRTSRSPEKFWNTASSPN